MKCSVVLVQRRDRHENGKQTEGTLTLPKTKRKKEEDGKKKKNHVFTYYIFCWVSVKHKGRQEGFEVSGFISTTPPPLGLKVRFKVCHPKSVNFKDKDSMSTNTSVQRGCKKPLLLEPDLLEKTGIMDNSGVSKTSQRSLTVFRSK